MMIRSLWISRTYKTNCNYLLRILIIIASMRLLRSWRQLLHPRLRLKLTLPVIAPGVLPMLATIWTFVQTYRERAALKFQYPKPLDLEQTPQIRTISEMTGRTPCRPSSSKLSKSSIRRTRVLLTEEFELVCEETSPQTCNKTGQLVPITKVVGCLAQLWIIPS